MINNYCDSIFYIIYINKRIELINEQRIIQGSRIFTSKGIVIQLTLRKGTTIDIKQ